MSAYIYCPKCRNETLDVDTLMCDCGYGHNEQELEKENKVLRDTLILIESHGGAIDPESGLRCNGSWCAEQERAALRQGVKDGR